MKSDFLNQRTSLTILQRRFLGVVILFVLVLWLGYSLLYVAWQPTYARRWLLSAGGVLVYELWFLWRGLRHNHRQVETTLLPTFGAGNVLTLTRGLGLGLLGGFLFSPWRLPSFIPWRSSWMVWMAIWPAGPIASPS